MPVYGVVGKLAVKMFDKLNTLLFKCLVEKIYRSVNCNYFFGWI